MKFDIEIRAPSTSVQIILKEICVLWSRISNWKLRLFFSLSHINKYLYSYIWFQILFFAFCVGVLIFAFEFYSYNKIDAVPSKCLVFATGWRHYMHGIWYKFSPQERTGSMDDLYTLNVRHFSHSDLVSPTLKNRHTQRIFTRSQCEFSIACVWAYSYVGKFTSKSWEYTLCVPLLRRQIDKKTLTSLLC